MGPASWKTPKQTKQSNKQTKQHCRPRGPKVQLQEKTTQHIGPVMCFSLFVGFPEVFALGRGLRKNPRRTKQSKVLLGVLLYCFEENSGGTFFSSNKTKQGAGFQTNKKKQKIKTDLQTPWPFIAELRTAAPWAYSLAFESRSPSLFGALSLPFLKVGRVPLLK